MKIGLLAYSTQTGLGIQTREFYNNIPCNKVLIVDLSKLNQMPVNHSWCKVTHRISNGWPSNSEVEWLVDGMDLIFVVETPLNYHLFEYARQRNVKTVLQFNPEFLDYFRDSDLPHPDVFAAPSLWRIEEVRNLVGKKSEVMYWPVPVDTKKIKFRRIEKIETLIHIIGRPAVYDRNGTLIALKLFKKLGMRFNYIISVQEPKERKGRENYKVIKKELEGFRREFNNRVKIIKDVPNYIDLYNEGDVLILPRRYGGLCLPLWEALSAGMPVIMPNISPNNTILPSRWLVEADIVGCFGRKPYILIYEAWINEIIKKLDNMKENIEEDNIVARSIADGMSWKAQRRLYIQRIKQICEL